MSFFSCVSAKYFFLKSDKTLHYNFFAEQLSELEKWKERHKKCFAVLCCVPLFRQSTQYLGHRLNNVMLQNYIVIEPYIQGAGKQPFW